jgi:hypothetical protein
MEAEHLNEKDYNDDDGDKRKRNTCLIICLILILVMTLPSTLAFLGIF